MTDLTSLTSSQEAAASMLAALNAPDLLRAPRCLLVSLDDEGNLQHQPIGMGQSVVRLETELIDHLNSKPFSDEWIAMLRDYCNGRLAAGDEAAQTDGFVIPRDPGQWEVAHVQAFQPLTLGGATQ